MRTNLKVMAMAMAISAGPGCALGTAMFDRGRDARGTARVGQGARALLVGPARVVHATGDRPVRWFVADRVNGDDRDCAGAPSPAVLAESARAQLTVSSGHVLCAAVARGATDVMWHKLPDVDDSLWARR